MLFQPPRLLRNAHIQSILASSKLRKPKLLKAASEMIKASREELLPAGESTYLHCIISEHQAVEQNTSRPLVILLHGWEGSAQSSYILSSATALYNQGYDVLRLHLRDHGPSHHLNAGLFHAARIGEVIEAVRSINEKYPRKLTYLTGFSLGGNFALRLAAHARIHQLKLNKVIAISPVVNPTNTMAALDNGSVIYRAYFMKKWLSLIHI